MASLCCCKSPTRQRGVRDDERQRPACLQKMSARTTSEHLYSTPSIRLLEPLPVTTSAQKPDAIFSATPIASMCKGSSDLADLVLEESESEPEQGLPGKRASATWGAVRNRLTRHISLERTLKKQPPSPAGRSQEEIERRAELKRLMHKRIQDELLCEDSIVEPCTESKQAGQKASLGNIKQPHGGPRDTIEFKVDNKEHLPPVISRFESARDSTKAAADRTTSKVIELPRGEIGSRLTKQAQAPLIHDQSSLENKFIRGLESSPLSVKIPIHSSDPSEQEIRKLQAKHWAQNERAHGDSRESQLSETQSVLAMWLQTQIAGSREPSFIRTEVPEGGVSAADLLGNQSLADDRPFETNVDNSPVLVHEDGCEPLGSPILPCVPPSTYTLTRSTDAGTIEPLQKDIAAIGLPKGLTLSPSQDLAQSYAVAMAFDNVEDVSSSAYPSEMPSIEASPRTSQINIFYNLNSQDLQSTLLPRAENHSGTGIDLATSHTMAGQTASVASCEQVHHLNTDLERYKGQLIIDTVSIAPTESASFQKREAELRTIEKRFAEAMLRKKAPTPVLSRFREEFGQPPRHASRRGTLMAKVHRSFERRSKTLSGNADLSIPKPLPSLTVGSYSVTASRVAPRVGSRAQDRITPWKTRLPVARHRLKHTDKDKDIHRPKSSSLSAHPLRTRVSSLAAKPSISASPPMTKSTLVRLTPGPSRVPGSKQLRSSGNPSPDKHERPSRRVSNLSRKMSKKPAEAPSTWYRLPSATRYEENIMATSSRGSVHIHDLEFDAIESSATTLNRSGCPIPSHGRLAGSRSVTVGHRVKSGLSKILPFMGSNSYSRDESSTLQECRTDPKHRARSTIPADMGGSATSSHDIPDNISVIRHSTSFPSSLASGISNDYDLGDPGFEVVEGGAVMTMQRFPALTSSQGQKRPTKSSSLAPTDVFLTPLSQSIELKKSEEVKLFGLRTLTSPNFQHHGAKILFPGRLPTSQSCPNLMNREMDTHYCRNLTSSVNSVDS